MPTNFRRRVEISIFVLGATLVLFAFALSWFAGDIVSQAEKVAADRTLIAKRAKAVDMLADLKRLAPQAQVYEKSLDVLLPLPDQLLDFPRWLDGLARGHHIALNFAFQGSQTAAQATTPGFIGFTVDISGAPDDLTNFLKDVELQVPRYLVSIDSFDVSQSGGTYRMFAQGKVFFQ